MQVFRLLFCHHLLVMLDFKYHSLLFLFRFLYEIPWCFGEIIWQDCISLIMRRLILLSYLSLYQAGIRRFRPLFDRIVVEKFLPEVVCITFQFLCFQGYYLLFQCSLGDVKLNLNGLIWNKFGSISPSPSNDSSRHQGEWSWWKTTLFWTSLSLSLSWPHPSPSPLPPPTFYTIQGKSAS